MVTLRNYYAMINHDEFLIAWIFIAQRLNVQYNIINLTQDVYKPPDRSANAKIITDQSAI